MKNKHIKLICFDLNKTLIDENTWEDLNIALGMTKEEDQVLWKLWDEGSMTYIQWQQILENVYKIRGKATRKTIERVVFNYTYLNGAKEVISYLQKRGYELALITGSLEMLAKHVSEELKIDHYASNNRLVFDDSDYIEKLEVVGEDEETKLEQLMSICKKLQIDITEVAYIGDGDNDGLIFEKCGRGVTFKGSKIENKAWKVVDSLHGLRDIF